MSALTRSLAQRRMWLGYLAALAAGASYGAAQTVAKHITTEFAPPLVGTAFALLFGFVYVSVMFHRHIPQDLGTSPRKGFVWFALSGICSAIGVSLLYLALDNAPLVVISPVVAINPLITLLLTHIFLRNLERITLSTMLGAGLVVLGVLIVTISNAT